MLTHLDVVLSFATVMLGVSLLVMVLTQTVSTLFNLRGRNLLRGLQTIFEQSGIEKAQSAQIAKAILENPMLADGTLFSRLAPAIRKDELLAMLDRLKLVKPLEKLEGDLVRAKHAAETWFDTAMDRVSNKFAGSMRLVTIGFSFAMAFILHLDAQQLLGRLSSDPAAREALLGATKSIQTKAEALLAPSESSTPATTDNVRALVKEAQIIASDFADTPFQLLPSPYPGLHPGDHFFGILASAVLLSLGAPFWFNVLRVSSSLRPVLATKVDRERETGTTAAGGMSRAQAT